MAPADDPAPSSTPSIAERLRQRLGIDVDPRIELTPGSEPALPGGARPPGSAGVLGRLGTRTQIASRYRVHGEINRGGMGAILEVFDEDLRRRLAMKVILDRATGTAGSDARGTDPTVLARFLEEAQVTGQLDHPGIVPVHELGIDPAGQVYFTMRLVHGRNLETIFDLVRDGAEGWTTTRALGVLQKVCEAMAYAHQKGVVHRDLKPANVMVGRFGEVYVMDWGLARVQNHADLHDVRPRVQMVPSRPVPAPPTTQGAAASSETAAATPTSADRSLLVETDRRQASGAGSESAFCTMDGDVVGTPSYMAPEQARGELDAIGERSDVYAVGAMLYRLLAQRAPFADADNGAVAIWRRVVAGPPSALDDLAPKAPGELVAICQKAMARAPVDRYPDMLSLAEDMRAFLEGRVVQAFETGALAEARKWVRRNRSLAAALAATLLTMVAGLGASLLFAKAAQDSAVLAAARQREADTNAALAEQRRTEAAASEEQARRQAAIAKEANAFLNDDVFAAIAPEHQGVDVTMREVLDRASISLALRTDMEPEVVAALRTTIGTSYSRLGEHRQAKANHEQALAIRRNHDGERSEPALQSTIHVAAAMAELGQYDAAIELYSAALEMAAELLGPDHRGTMAIQNDLALALKRAGRFGEARARFEAVLDLEVEILGATDRNTLATENNLALLDLAAGRHEDAYERLQNVVQRRRETLGARHPETLESTGSLAVALTGLGRFRESEARARELLPLFRDVYGKDHPRVGLLLGTLGTALMQNGGDAEAKEVLAEALRILHDAYGDDHPDTLQARHNLAFTITEPGRQDEVLRQHQEVLDGRRRVLGVHHPATLDSMNSVAGALRSLRRFDEAEAMFRETLALNQALFGDDHPSTCINRENLGGVLFAKRDYAGSEELVRKVLEVRKRVLGSAHPNVAKTTFNLAMVLAGKGDSAAALPLFEEALAINLDVFGETAPAVAECHTRIGDQHAKARRSVDAQRAYEQALAVHRSMHEDDRSTAYLLHQIGAMLYEQRHYASALDKLAEAVPLRERLHGPDALETRVSLAMQARLLERNGRHAEAEPIALEFMRRTERAPDKNIEHVQRGRALLVDIYTGLGRPDDADQWR